MTAVDLPVSIESRESFSMNEKLAVHDTLADQEDNLAVVQELRQSDDWEEVIAYEHLSDSARAHSLTANTLRANGLIERRPVKFFNGDKTKCIIVLHLGTNL
jgi:hypothetical protein